MDFKILGERLFYQVKRMSKWFLSIIRHPVQDVGFVNYANKLIAENEGHGRKVGEFDLKSK
jgi:hypothetical protein